MKIEATNEFDKDTKKISVEDKRRLEGVIQMIANMESPGKRLHHMTNVFSVRPGNKRLVYQLVPKESKATLLFFKSREDVYDYGQPSAIAFAPVAPPISANM